MSLKSRRLGDGLRDLAAGLEQDVGQALGLLHRRLDLVQPEVVRDLLGEVHDVVQRRGQRVDVLAVDRRDEGLVQAPDDVVRDPVPVLLADQDVARQVGPAVGVRAQHLIEQISGAEDVAASFLEQVEELAVAGGKRQAHGAAHVNTCKSRNPASADLGARPLDPGARALLPRGRARRARRPRWPGGRRPRAGVRRGRRRAAPRTPRGGRRRRACPRCPGCQRDARPGLARERQVGVAEDQRAPRPPPRAARPRRRCASGRKLSTSEPGEPWQNSVAPSRWVSGRAAISATTSRPSMPAHQRDGRAHGLGGVRGRGGPALAVAPDPGRVQPPQPIQRLRRATRRTGCSRRPAASGPRRAASSRTASSAGRLPCTS